MERWTQDWGKFSDFEIGLICFTLYFTDGTVNQVENAQLTVFTPRRPVICQSINSTLFKVYLFVYC